MRVTLTTISTLVFWMAGTALAAAPDAPAPQPGVPEIKDLREAGPQAAAPTPRKGELYLMTIKHLSRGTRLQRSGSYQEKAGLLGRRTKVYLADRDHSDREVLTFSSKKGDTTVVATVGPCSPNAVPRCQPGSVAVTLENPNGTVVPASIELPSDSAPQSDATVHAVVTTPTDDGAISFEMDLVLHMRSLSEDYETEDGGADMLHFLTGGAPEGW